MGPWTHSYPCRGDPGPRIGYLQEALRWWQYWLAGEATDIMNEPLFRVWIHGEERPRPWYKDHAGSWAAEEAWPSPRIDWRVFHLNANGLESTAKVGRDMSICSPATAGTDYGRWGGYGGESPDLAIDQRREDGQSLCFDTAPLEDDLTLLGAPELNLELMVDSPKVNLAVRLCDVYPDGTSAVMTYGVLNLSHRDSHEFPEPARRRALHGDDQAQRLCPHHPEGPSHSPGDPDAILVCAWPQPDLATITVKSGASRLCLPVRPPSPLDRKVRFERPEISPPAPSRELIAGRAEKHVEDDLGTGIRTIRLVNDSGTLRLDDRAIVTASSSSDTFTIHPDDPLSAKLVSEYRWSMRSGEADTETRSRTEFSADRENFYLTWRVEALEAGRIIHTKQATRKFPRDFC